jgi:hypothetical protein
VEHELKCHPKYMPRLADGSKTFEIRKNDRDFQVGDTLILKEYDPADGWPDHGSYMTLVFTVTYVSSEHQQNGYVVLGLVEKQSD